MKPLKVFMLMTAFLFTVEAGVAQTNKPSKKEQRKIERAERKKLKEEARQQREELVESLVENQTFVLEASTIFGRYMTPFQVQPNINFVKIAGNQVILQTANPWGFGYNGLGGVTLNGSIQEYRVKKNKKGEVQSVLIHFTSPVSGHSTLNMDIQAGGISRALFVDNWGRRLTFHGQVESLESSRVFEGRPII